MHNYFSLIAIATVLLILLPHSPISSQAEKNDELTIHAQITVRNSHGQLVTYLESQRIVIENLQELNDLLVREEKPDSDPIINVNGNQYRLIKRTFTHTFESETVFATAKLSYEKEGVPQLLVYSDHDGYPVSKGDKLSITWTIIRPIPNS